MTKIFLASTMFGAMTLAAAIDEGRFGPHDERWLLLTWNNAVAAEIHPSLEELTGFETLRDRFDDVVSWNRFLAPLHPAGWGPRPGEIPLMGRLIRAGLGIDDHVSELVLESIGVRTSQTIASILRDCPISLYSDGLMTYGPTRAAPATHFGGRIERLLHLPLVPGLTPLLLREFYVTPEPIGRDAFRAVIDGLPESRAIDLPTGAAVIVGQYLSALDILTIAEEDTLLADMLRALVAGGHHDVVFKPHPAAGNGQVHRLREVAASLDVTLHVAPEAEPVEVLFRDHRPALVVGAFSTALEIAQQFFDIPVATMGGELMLERLAPFQNSNRIPATITDATLPRLQLDGTTATPPALPLQALVDAVGYCMQAIVHPELRATAVSYLAEHGRQRYFKKKRLEALGLIPKKKARKPRPTSAQARAAQLRAIAVTRLKRRIRR